MYPATIMLYIKELFSANGSQSDTTAAYYAAYINNSIENVIKSGNLTVHTSDAHADYYVNTVNWATHLRYLDVSSTPIYSFSLYIFDKLKESNKVTHKECIEGVELYVKNDLHKKLINSATARLTMNTFNKTDSDLMDICTPDTAEVASPTEEQESTVKKLDLPTGNLRLRRAVRFDKV
jgi:hypothetical protein